MLSLTDTYFLMGIPYAAARGLGWDLFAAFDLVVATLAAIGFWSFAALARSLGSGRLVGAAFAAVFAFGSLVTFKLAHAQTYLVTLLPLVALCLVQAWRRAGVPGAARACAAGILTGLLALTAPQTVWFLALDTLIWLVLMAVLLAIARPPDAGAWWRPLPARLPAAFGGLAGLAIGLAPAVLAYRRTAVHQRDWAEVSSFLARPADFLFVQPGNVLWHHLLYRTGIADAAGRNVYEAALGYTPGLVLTLLAAVALLCGSNRVRLASGLAVLALLLVPLLGAALTMEVGGVTPWSWVYGVLPGARGLRTPFRVQVVSLFPLCLGLALAVSFFLRTARSERRPGRAAVLCALVTVCVVEQADTQLSTRITGPELAWLGQAARRPPYPCDVFYLLPSPPSPGRSWPFKQSDAMLLAEVMRMPTVNGNSSWSPDGWDLSDPESPNYAPQLRQWLADHGQGRAVCGVDPRANVWRQGLGPLG